MRFRWERARNLRFDPSPSGGLFNAQVDHRHHRPRLPVVDRGLCPIDHDASGDTMSKGDSSKMMKKTSKKKSSKMKSDDAK
jgi:hypothetical protein